MTLCKYFAICLKFRLSFMNHPLKGEAGPVGPAGNDGQRGEKGEPGMYLHDKCCKLTCI